jgi:hypothetical protein
MISNGPLVGNIAIGARPGFNLFKPLRRRFPATYFGILEKRNHRIFKLRQQADRRAT